MKVSVVIIAKHAEKTIRYAVKSLLMQTMKPYEIIVVVDSLADPTIEAIKGLPVKVILNEGAGCGSARKTGINASKGDAIAFIDADCIADYKWIESLVEAFLSNNIFLQAGKSINVKKPLDVSANSLKRDAESPILLKFALTQNFAIKKEAINIIGNFDSWFKKGGEDLDFCIRARKAEYGIFYNSNAVIYHLADGYGMRRAWRDGRSRAQCFVKHRDVMFRDAFTMLFHLILIITSLTLLAKGYLGFAFLLIILSIGHRVYRAIIGVRQGNAVLASLVDSFTTYISIVSFVFSFPSLALDRLRHARTVTKNCCQRL
jgi:glycosyltransferase involved in cell wall biosynthesis